MKIFLLSPLLIVLAAPVLHAEEYLFQYDRFGAITLHTDAGKANVLIEDSVKDSAVNTIFKSPLKPQGPGVFVTPHGTAFTLKHLSKPVVNDSNRHINSGDWQLTVSGSGEEFTRLKPKMPKVSFGHNPPLVYLGEENRTSEGQ